MSTGLVTGAGSFVGASIALLLAEKLGGVTATFRSPTQWSDLLAQNESVKLLQVDLNEQNLVSKFPSYFDFVVHCAAVTDHVTISQLVRGNIDATRNLITAVAHTNCKLWIQLSTVSVHGEGINGVISETTPMGELTPVAKTKLMAEILLKNVGQDFAVRCIRLPAILGPGARNHWPSRVIKSALLNQPIVIFNPTKLFNNSVHIADLARFVHALTLKNQVGFDAFPIASTNPITISQATQCLIDSGYSKSRVTIDRTPKSSFYIDDSYARHRYGYNSRSISSALSNYAELELGRGDLTPSD